jgi:hypothetical protein
VTDDRDLAEVLAFDVGAAIREAQAEAAKRSPEERQAHTEAMRRARYAAACRLHPGGPKWLHESLVKRGFDVSPGESLARALATGARGEARRPLLTRVAGFLLACGVNPFVVVALLISWAYWMCSPPLPEEDVVDVVNEIARREVTRQEASAR